MKSQAEVLKGDGESNELSGWDMSDAPGYEAGGAEDPSHESDKRLFEVYEASPDDALGIEYMRYQSWLDTYPNDECGLTREFIEKWFVPQLAEAGMEATRQRIAETLDDPDAIQLVAKDDSGKVIGTARATRGEKGRKVFMFYVDKSAHGTGVSSEIMTGLLGWLGDEEDISLTIASYNERARAFYKKFGFNEVGEPAVLDVPNMPEQKMVRSGKKENLSDIGSAYTTELAA